MSRPSTARPRRSPAKRQLSLDRLEERVLLHGVSPADSLVAYVDAYDPAHTRIGIAGMWDTAGTIVPAPLFGPRLDNLVAYVGPFVEHRLARRSAAAAG